MQVTLFVLGYSWRSRPHPNAAIQQHAPRGPVAGESAMWGCQRAYGEPRIEFRHGPPLQSLHPQRHSRQWYGCWITFHVPRTSCGLCASTALAAILLFYNTNSPFSFLEPFPATPDPATHSDLPTHPSCQNVFHCPSAFMNGRPAPPTHRLPCIISVGKGLLAPGGCL